MNRQFSIIAEVIVWIFIVLVAIALLPLIACAAIIFGIIGGLFGL